MKKIFFAVSVLIASLLVNITVSAQNNTISVSERYYAIKNDNSLWVWDMDDEYNVIGYDKILDDVKSVHNGYAIQSDGTLWECEPGYLNNFQPIEEPIKVMNGVKKISSEYSHMLLLKNDNTLWGVGGNDRGQLAQDINEERFDEPVKIMNNVQDIGAGFLHSIVHKTDGSVLTFGDNKYGQLGVGETIQYSENPQTVMGNIKNIIAGQSSCFAIDEANTLFRWGTNYGEGIGIGEKDLVFIPTKYVREAKFVNSHWGFNLVLRQDNTLWLYGDTEGSETGYSISSTGINFENLPQKLMNNVNSMSEWHYDTFHKTLILNNDGELYLFDLVEGDVPHTPQYNLIKIMDDVKLPEEIPYSEPKSLTDISDENEETQASIKALSKAEIINGTSDTEFSPDKPITRAEIAALLLRMTAKAEEEGNGGFWDVTTDDWYYNTAGASKKYNIVAGFEDNTFRGDETISKIQLISLVARTLRNEKKHKDEELQTVEKSEIPDWAEKDISLALQEELISQTDLTNMNDDMTRGDAAVILYRLYGMI